MKSRISLSLVATLIFSMLAIPAAAEQIGHVESSWRLMGNDRIVIEAFDDASVPGVSCHLSRHKTGGLFGDMGLAENRSDASLACRQIGPISVDLEALSKRNGEMVFTERTNAFFKEQKVVRFVDLKRKTLIYLVYSTKLIDGSPKNAISSVPVMPWGEK